MIALSRYLKEQDPLAKVVFIGPCTAKKREAIEDENKSTDHVMTFEELQAVLNGKDIDISTLEETQLDNASHFGRLFARIGGLSESVVEMLKEQNTEFEVKPVLCEGIENIKKALSKIKRGKDIDFNFLEGMVCMGGCIGGPCNINHQARDKMQIDKFGQESSKQTITSSLEEIKK